MGRWKAPEYLKGASPRPFSDENLPNRRYTAQFGEAQMG